MADAKTLPARLAQALATAATIVRTQNGNQHEDINALLADCEALIAEAKAEPVDYTDYLNGLPLAEALWWFIENVDDETPNRTTYLFRLRERVRNGEVGPAESQLRRLRIDELVEDWLDTIRNDGADTARTILRLHYERYSDDDLERAFNDAFPDEEEGLRDD